MTDIEARVTDVFRSVFGDESLEVTDSMTADDVEGWDSLSHINLIFSLEEEFGIQFSSDDLAEVGDVGDLRRKVQELAG